MQTNSTTASGSRLSESRFGMDHSGRRRHAQRPPEGGAEDPSPSFWGSVDGRHRPRAIIGRVSAGFFPSFAGISRLPGGMSGTFMSGFGWDSFFFPSHPAAAITTATVTSNTLGTGIASRCPFRPRVRVNGPG